MQKYVTFSSRGDTLGFLAHLRRAGIYARTAPTPVRRSDLCALSVQVDAQYLEDVKRLLAEGGYRSFRGVF